MATLINTIAKQYPHLKPTSVERNRAFGVVFNNTVVGGVTLSQHPAGKRVAGEVLRALGYVDTVDIKGNLDDFL